MNKNKIEIISSIAMIGILSFMMMIIFSKFIYEKIEFKSKTISNDEIEKSDIEKIDYSKLYPLDKDAKKNSNEKNIIDKYLNKINAKKEFLENKTSTELYNYERFVELSYIYNKVLNYRIVSNHNPDYPIEISKNNFAFYKEEGDMKYFANKLIDLNDYVKSLNIDYLYIEAPDKISNDIEINKIYRDNTNKNMDSLLKFIYGKVEYLDLRESIKNKKLNNLDLFFETDHHWKPETGLLIAKEISDYLNNNYDMNLKIDNLDSNKYNYKVYPKMFLGSAGRKVSLANAYPEDFTIITPEFDTKLNLSIPDMNVSKVGSFSDTLINWNQVKYDNYYKISQYTAYMYPGSKLINVKNEYVKNNKKILWIQDSFSDVVTPFIALETESISLIDLRSFNGSIKKYIEKTKPDIVITMYSGNVMGKVDSNTELPLWDNLNQ